MFFSQFVLIPILIPITLYCIFLNVYNEVIPGYTAQILFIYVLLFIVTKNSKTGKHVVDQYIK